MINLINYKPKLWLRNGHIQSILPSLFRKVNDVSYTRERIETPDADFLDLDWSTKNKGVLAIISHGLEGNSHRAYIKGMVKALNQANIDCLAWNYRSCSGETNRLLRSYHNGSTDDLELVVNKAISHGYDKIVLIGFSMGGNISLLYLGQKASNTPEQIKAAVTFSVPLNLKDSSECLSKFSNKIYMIRFLRKLHKKILEKMEMFPGQIDDEGYHKINNFKSFDDRYTAPLNGFKDAEDYWAKCSSGRLLEKINTPVLIVNAEDDPFLGSLCYPDLDRFNRHIKFEIPKYGGHVGFINTGINDLYWSELRTIEFINSILK